MLHLDNIMTGQVTVQYTANFTTKLHGQNPFYIYFVATYFNVPVPRILMVRYQLIANANSPQIICWWTLKLWVYNPCDVQFTFFGWWKLNRRLQYSIAPTCLLKPLILLQLFKASIFPSVTPAFHWVSSHWSLSSWPSICLCRYEGCQCLL